MKQLKIKLNGKTVRVYKTSRNDLHNSFSPKHHIPSMPNYDRHYKARYLNQLSVNKGLLATIGVILFTGTFIYLGMDIRYKSLKADLTHLQTVREHELGIAYDNILAYNELETKYASCSAKLPQPRTFKGKVSFYSKDGCLGCGEKQITASGEPFDENKYTMALPLQWTHIKLPTTMTVTNLDNGKTITVRANDRHGAYNSKYGWRVADLSKAAYIALGAKTDISTLQFSY